MVSFIYKFKLNLIKLNNLNLILTKLAFASLRSFWATTGEYKCKQCLSPLVQGV